MHDCALCEEKAEVLCPGCNRPLCSLCFPWKNRTGCPVCDYIIEEVPVTFNKRQAFATYDKGPKIDR